MQITNKKDCSKYADVICKYELYEDEVLNKHFNKIVFYNGSSIITDYNQLFTVNE